jgi:hypothetical protein
MCSGWRRQYVFVAATMPAEGKKSTAAELRAAFPEAVWVSGARLHRPQRRVRHRWVPVGPGDWEAALVVRDPLCQAMCHLKERGL